MEFSSFEDVLDFAILQEKAAQQFYTKLSDEVQDESVQLFYRTMAQEERDHEQKLSALKRCEYVLAEPDIEALRDSGYLAAMPISPTATLEEAVRYAFKKERSAHLLYTSLSRICDRKELTGLFEHLAEQENSHANFFQSKYSDLLEKH